MEVKKMVRFFCILGAWGLETYPGPWGLGFLSQAIQGTLKKNYEDFVVKELSQEGEARCGSFGGNAGGFANWGIFVVPKDPQKAP